MYKRLYPLTKPRYCAKHVERMGIISLETPEGDLIKEASHGFKESIAYQERIGITKNVDKHGQLKDFLKERGEYKEVELEYRGVPFLVRDDAPANTLYMLNEEDMRRGAITENVDKPTLLQRIKAFIWKSQ